MLDDTIEKETLIKVFDLTLIRENRVYQGAFGITNIEYEVLESQKEKILGNDEMIFFQALPDARSKDSYLRSRFISKMVLARHMGQEDFTKIGIRHGVFHQPLVAGTNHISISHTGNYAACLVFPDEHPMGLDIEKVTDNAVEAIGSQLTEKEKMLAGDLSGKKEYVYTRFWTTKEALSKVLKTGLMIPFQLLEVKSVMKEHEYDVSYFRNFIQYKSVSFRMGEQVISVVLPAETNFNAKQINTINNKF